MMDFTMSNIEYCLHQRNNAPLYAQLERLDPTQRFKVTVTPWKSKRSLEQNKLLWEFFTGFAAHVGYEGKQEIEDLKQMVTLKLNPKIVTDKATGEVIQLPPETSKMNTKDFSEMMDKVIRYASGLGFYWEGQ